MLALGLGDVTKFPFVDKPNSKMINDGFTLLIELGAVDEDRRLTDIGRQLAKLPIDPRIARMILAAAQKTCLKEILIIASALSIQDPRERPMDAQQAADLAQEQFKHELSDFLSYLKLWEFYHEQSKHLSKNKLRNLNEQIHSIYNNINFIYHFCNYHLVVIELQGGIVPFCSNHNNPISDKIYLVSTRLWKNSSPYVFFGNHFCHFLFLSILATFL
jgi:HrpA-like RNA helicase